jgi:hypothetical protein
MRCLLYDDPVLIQFEPLIQPLKLNTGTRSWGLVAEENEHLFFWLSPCEV